MGACVYGTGATVTVMASDLIDNDGTYQIMYVFGPNYSMCRCVRLPF